jgi:putative sigma-54 modulation protein
MTEPKFTARGLELTDSIKNYIIEKINKHEALLKESILIQVEVTYKHSHQGVDNDFKVEINVNMPQAFIKVEDKGADVYSIVDKLEALLKRRLKRYHDLHKKWTGKSPWKLAQDELPDKNITDLDYQDYEPVIVKIKRYEDNKPKHPAEAIEQMELLGYNSFLFKNIETNSYSMIYKRPDGNYGLVEPANP